MNHEEEDGGGGGGEGACETTAAAAAASAEVHKYHSSKIRSNVTCLSQSFKIFQSQNLERSIRKLSQSQNEIEVNRNERGRGY